MKRGDWVTTKWDQLHATGAPCGRVTRCARDGTWADVDWFGPEGHYRWSKRMPVANLVVVPEVGT